MQNTVKHVCRTILRSIRPLLFSVVVVLLGTALALAATITLSIQVPPGNTEIDFSGDAVLVETTDFVVVYLSKIDGQVTGRVDPAPGTTSARVKITLVDDPDRIIFEGRVVTPIYFSDYLPQETGRGEQ
ncbi:hypothetical protein DRQ53_04495 [bacterium]|nr:MAG: hypothetical protein DRQ53_04495 [bacterium]